MRFPHLRPTGGCHSTLRRVAMAALVHLFPQRRPGRYSAEPRLTSWHRRRAPAWGFPQPPHLVHAGRMAHADGEQRLQRLASSEHIRQGGGLGRLRSFLLLHSRKRSKPPRCLPTHPPKSACGSGLRGKQKGASRGLKTLAHPRAQALQLLEEGERGLGMLQGVGDQVGPSAAPRRPMRSRT